MTVASAVPPTACPADMPAAMAPADLPHPARAEEAAARRAALETEPLTAAVVGASGYTGALLVDLLLAHPGVSLEQVSSEQLAGTPVADHLPRLRTGLSFVSPAKVGGIDVAFACTPHGQAAHVVGRLLDDGARVVDLSADFRLDAATYAQWYGTHPRPELLAGAVYGLTELHRPAIAGATLVANPGCYPTAALLALAPLAPLGLLDVVIDAKSGVSGAGKTPSERTHFCSVAGNLSAYGLDGHRHYPEIVAGLAAPGAAGGGLADPGADRHVRAPPHARRARHSRDDLRARRAAAVGSRAARPVRRGVRRRAVRVVRRRAARAEVTWSARTTAASSPRSTRGPRG